MARMVPVILLLLALPAHAAEKHADELGVTEADCRAVAAYQQAQGTEYKPGVDVHGKPVMEADLTPSAVKPPETYKAPLTVDIMHGAGGGLEGKAQIGVIEVGKDGKVAFNGKPLEGDSFAALQAACAKLGKK